MWAPEETRWWTTHTFIVQEENSKKLSPTLVLIFLCVCTLQNNSFLEFETLWSLHSNKITPSWSWDPFETLHSNFWNTQFPIHNILPLSLPIPNLVAQGPKSDSFYLHNTQGRATTIWLVRSMALFSQTWRCVAWSQRPVGAPSPTGPLWPKQTVGQRTLLWRAKTNYQTFFR